MGYSSGSFSHRYGFRRSPSGPLIYHQAPERVRVGLLAILQQKMRKKPSYIRRVICNVLRSPEEPSNWSEYPNVWGEVQDRMLAADWYEVYDIVEAFANECSRNGELPLFSDCVNQLFAEEGIGWRLNETFLEVHGDPAFEGDLTAAEDELEESDFARAASELREARSDLSRRPEPDLSGAVTHAMGALECVSREVTGDRRSTLGQIVARNPDLFPRPLDEAASRLWGYASDQARHVREDRKLEWEDVLLVVGVAGVLCSYLNAKPDIRPGD